MRSQRNTHYSFHLPLTKYYNFCVFIFRHVYNKAKMHRLRYGYALAPNFKVARVLSRIERPVLEEIMRFITSDSVTMGTAYGTYTIKDSNNKRVQIAKVIRQRLDLCLRIECACFQSSFHSSFLFSCVHHSTLGQESIFIPIIQSRFFFFYLQNVNIERNLLVFQNIFRKYEFSRQNC